MCVNLDSPGSADLFHPFSGRAKYHHSTMLDIGLVLSTLLVALLLRLEPLRRLRSLTAPLLFVSAAALAQFVTGALDLDPAIQ